MGPAAGRRKRGNRAGAGPAGGKLVAGAVMPSTGLVLAGRGLGLGALGLLGSRLLTLGLVGSQHLPLDQRHRSASLLHGRLGLGTGVIDRQAELRLELAVAQQAQAVERAAD